MADLYGIVALYSYYPGRCEPRRVAVRVGLRSQWFREFAEQECARLTNLCAVPQIIQYEVVTAEEWDKLAVQQVLEGINPTLETTF